MAMNLGSFASRSVAQYIVAKDGTGDFTDVQSAVNAIGPNGGNIFIKEGVYTITSAIDIAGVSITITGIGQGAAIKSTGNHEVFNITGNHHFIENINISGSGLGNVNNHGIFLDNVDWCSVRNCRIDSCGGDGIKTSACGIVNLQNNHIIGNKGYGINSDNDFYYLVNGNVIINNLLGGINAYILYDGTISDNNITSNPAHGIEFDGNGDWLDVVISNNVINYNGNDGIYIYNSGEVIISNNTISANVHHGIRLNTCFGCNISSNISSYNDDANTVTYDGICLESNVDNCIVSSNRCRENDRYEINVANANCDKNIIMGNQCLGTDHVGTINDAGTNTHPNGASGTNNLALDDLNIIA
ncbi:MAG TPA: right-handed parallel beta-helix repeat-containing protein [Ignavibacteriaceae bacterium]|nr:right-handed parallel beta-helix repeat-containing protein [Ignavibacteriaceae bacterium]